MSGRSRDFKAEYARRVARGQAKGLSRSAARGHPKPRETVRGASKPVQFDRQLEEALQAIKAGKTLTASAKSVHVSPERLRRYLAQSKIVKRKGRRWVFKRKDSRTWVMPMFSGGHEVTVLVHQPAASRTGQYNAAVRMFLSSNDAGHLQSFKDGSVVDISGHSHPFETDPNELYRLTASGGGDGFEDIYRIIA